MHCSLKDDNFAARQKKCSRNLIYARACVNKDFVHSGSIGLIGQARALCYNPTIYSSAIWIPHSMHESAIITQHAKKVVSDSPGLVDFAIRLVSSVINLPDGQVKFFEEFKLQKYCQINLLIKTFLGLVEMMFGLVNVSFSCKNDFLCTLSPYW